jgi:hypothetical protein
MRKILLGLTALITLASAEVSQEDMKIWRMLCNFKDKVFCEKIAQEEAKNKGNINQRKQLEQELYNQWMESAQMTSDVINYGADAVLLGE